MEHFTGSDRLVRYVVGESSPEERADIEHLMASDPSLARVVDEFRTIWQTDDVMRSDWNVSAAWSEVSHQLGRTPRQLGRTPRRYPKAWTLWRVAAMLVVAIGLGVLYASGVFPSKKAASLEYVTSRGQRMELYLSDGTRVVLGADSRLAVLAAYGTTHRNVRLEGQAHFEVEHDASRLFTVYTAQGVAEDLGTRFDVIAYPRDTTLQVVVADGRVALRAEDAPKPGAILSAGELGYLRKDGTVIVEPNVDLGSRLSWLQGRLVFKNTPLRDALPQLSRWYDLEFRLADSSIAALPLTATFGNQLTSEMLDLLVLALGVRQERQGRVLTLYAN